MRTKKKVIALIGNPNIGKSALFNLLTGANQCVGNWPGVTVERMEGDIHHKKKHLRVIDLPGTYTLVANKKDQALDESICCQYLQQSQPEFIVNVLDATNLTRNLYLTLQLIELNFPLIIACNRIDIARKIGIHIDFELLSQSLGCPVVPVSANTKEGIEQLKDELIQFHSNIDSFTNKKTPWTENLSEQHHNRIYEHKKLIEKELVGSEQNKLGKAIHQLELQTEHNNNSNFDITLAKARYDYIEELIAQVQSQSLFCPIDNKQESNKLDKIILHRFLGIPIFLFVMYSMFLFAINFAGAFQDFIDTSTHAIFIDGLSYWLQTNHSPQWIITLLANGLGTGINTLFTFVPVIAGMFFFLAFLEGSGYMARAAFVMDRLMRYLKLPGKSFVPLIVGFGCNVPAILSTRTLENKRERILTTLMTPFMSCGARLAIFTVFVSAFFGVGGHNIVFLLYTLGIVIAVLTGLLLNKTFLKGSTSALVMELPPFQLPKMSYLLKRSWQRLNKFLFNAGKLILPISMVIGILNHVPAINLNYVNYQNETTFMESIGKKITPFFKPMGVTDENWPATVGLLTGVLAKEVVVGTLNTLYSKNTKITVEPEFNLKEKLAKAFHTIPENLMNTKSAFFHPLASSAPTQQMQGSAIGEMSHYFGNAVTAFAYLLFILLYFPCVSTVATMAKEIGKSWAVFSIFWSTGLAYCSAVIFYQLATIRLHILKSLGWTALMIGMIAFAVLTLISMAKQYHLENKRSIPIKIS